ncbi:oxidoreductase [Actinoplanes sp. SE50]|uniref:Gfo/Idh/MocA family protein n=1 Tax=unclassified Actinoplanes TaxID=2626549 RepID=UPI00023EDD2D|nr:MULTISPECIES: Gfo/Idh/MocA family oxidoreductase [unclassified Actinoplanes]AEV88575.1 oxidoreductase domain-containing protein [Actinoplanes sp. SE50/110]ATO86980.1 oxidoreductase [Actinoplanes sp. SE50]SLM04398.1 oxidoreductase [Actinoplanes sp. SE50/110]
MTESVSVAVVGAGSRGGMYARVAADSGRARVVAVAEPDDERRERFAAEFGLPADRVHRDWTGLLAGPRVADAVIVATQDRLHEAPAVALLGHGYDVLLEKPMAPSEASARRIADAALASGRIFGVCHVLRYTPYTAMIRELIRDGALGDVINVQHLEPVGWWHQAHAYVRGNWRSEAGSGPMLLTKACHDVDWIMHVVGDGVARVSSFGGLAHFRPDRQPAGAADRCVDCAVERECPYSAKRLYLGCLGDPKTERWPLGPVTSDATEAGVLHALRTGPYGRCVYRCDNDVVDHQVVNFEFAGGATATLTMTAFSPSDGYRRTRIFGSHGSLEGDGRTLTLTDFRDGSERVIPVPAGAGGTAAGGHGGGDAGLVAAFLTAVRTRDESYLGSGAAASLDSHRVVWAAERARHTGTVITL